MSELYKNKYRIGTTRLKNWNYNREAMYFVTICTKNREHYFGEIKNGIMQHSEIGKIASSEWFYAVKIRPDMNLELGEFVVMPNHIHGIIMIGKNEFNTPGIGLNHSGDGLNHSGDAMHCVSTGKTPYKNQFAPQSKNLSSILRGYKSAVTTYARKNNIEFEWQTRFHDHIIRSAGAYERISTYIKNNPSNWKEDKFHQE